MARKTGFLCQIADFITSVIFVFFEFSDNVAYSELVDIGVKILVVSIVQNVRNVDSDFRII